MPNVTPERKQRKAYTLGKLELDWLDKESARVDRSHSAIIRQLIRKEIEKETGHAQMAYK